MNLGDGLKLETEVLDGKPRLILAPCVSKSKPSVKICNKNKTLKHTLKTKQNGHVQKSVQTTYEKNECLTKPKTGTRLSEINAVKNHETLLSTKDSSKESCNKDHAFIIQKDNTTVKPDNTRTSFKKPLASSKKFKKHPVSEDLRDNLVCLTQQQLEQILMAVKEGTKGACQLQNEKKEQTISNSAASNLPVNQAPEEENIMRLLQKAGEAPSVPSEHSFISKTKQGSPKQIEQKVIMNSWKPADMFSNLGERERDKTLLDAKKSQWKKELDEQVALKKKLKETLESETKYHWSQKIDTVKCCSEKLQFSNQAKMAFSDDLSAATEDTHTCRILTTEPSEASPGLSSGQTGQFSSFSSPDLPVAIRTAFVLGEATPVEHPFIAVKREQQKKWLEELVKQKEADKLRKMEEKYNFSKGEEHDKWTVHFDSFRNHSISQYPLNTTYKKQPEALHLSLEPQDQTTFTHTPVCHPTPTEVESSGKAIGNSVVEPSQKASFLRSMTALLDPAEIEERDRRRQKQLEHQKAIMAQVEEKRKKKQLEEEQRKMEEQEEESRLAREQELMKQQFEEDLLKQKQKEEIMTLKTNELYQTMQKAQELAQRLKQEQRIKELAQKGHDISKLQKNLGGGDAQCDSYSADLNGFMDVSDHHANCSGEKSNIVNQDIKNILSPRKDTAVQTDSVNIDVRTSSEICTERIRNGRVDCVSPNVSTEYKVDVNSKKCKQEPQYVDKKISEKENIVSYSDLYEQCEQKQKQTKPMERNGKRPDWNINKPCKRYIPASERYPRRLQKQREEKKARRQMELLQLVERNSPGNLSQKKSFSPDRSPSASHEDIKNKEESSSKNNLIEQRSESPPVPAVKNKQTKASDFPAHDGSEDSIYTDKHQSERLCPCAETERPPSSHFVPYVRTNEVYYLDPDALMTRPSTHDLQYQQLNGTKIQNALHTPRQIFSSDHITDPLFNPNVVRNRQQAILKGLSELRQGLLQKQKELETCLIPSIISQEESFISPF
ncbi:coiled-coil domain-containing protein 66 isoform X3 [Hemicordylus capensis]|uniref:coiled-coil domain-containing protein 66 isoform X3 n=1 Tax=Hemicordylus capensis TaxID=884348 RepID=UPI00230276EE|nr:coiled-coil domain-containing protein 66 isoform X3 [Hemicordylus capensis]